MIDEIKITGLLSWPEEARAEFTREITIKAPKECGVHPSKNIVRIVLPEEWANLKREQLKHEIVDTLDKARVDHGLEARVQTIENVEIPDDGFSKASEQ